MLRLLNVSIISVLALSCIPFTAGAATGAKASLTPVIVDKQGKVLGPVLDPTDSSHPTVAVQLRPGQPRVSISVQQVGSHGFTPRSVGLFWQTTDCSGTPYVNSAVPATAGLDFPTDFKTYWYPSPGQKLVARQVASYHRFGQCVQAHDLIYPFTAAAKSIDITTLGFQPPFDLDLRDISSSTPATPSPYLIDSQNKVLGPVLSRRLFGDVVVLRLKPSGALTLLAIRKDGLGPLRTPVLKEMFYESTDCSGKAWVYDNWISQAWLDPTDHKTILYIGADKTKITVRSSTYGYDCQKASSPAQYTVNPILPATVAEQSFTQPFAIKLR